MRHNRKEYVVGLAFELLQTFLIDEGSLDERSEKEEIVD
jgi:hypothetical protein